MGGTLTANVVPELYGRSFVAWLKYVATFIY
jgi:hypothetical protein